jgi:hypothetical protein
VLGGVIVVATLVWVGLALLILHAIGVAAFAG